MEEFIGSQATRPRDKSFICNFPSKNGGWMLKSSNIDFYTFKYSIYISAVLWELTVNKTSSNLACFQNWQPNCYYEFFEY